MRTPLLLTTVLLLAACSSQPTVRGLSPGPFDGTGTLIPVEVSLIRRGTHALVVNGQSVSYLESKTVNLTAFEGQTVHVRGTVQPNTKPGDLPVLITESVDAPLNNQGLHIWNIPSMNLRIISPDTWKGVIEKGVVTFTLGEGAPLMTVRQQEGSGSELPNGTPFFVAGQRSVRTTQKGSMAQEIFIEGDDGLIHIDFDAGTQDPAKRLEEGQVLLAQFEQLVSTLTFLKEGRTATIQSGSGAGIPCGGSAGILCPAGFFCNITDTENQIGHCRSL